MHTRILSATAPLNLALNYLLGEVLSLMDLWVVQTQRHSASHLTVDGPIPALRLGFAGAPLSTVLSHNALAIMLILYIVQRSIRDEVEYLRGQNTAPDEPVRANASSRPTTDNPSEVSFFTGLGTLVLAGISGVSKSASQLWSKDFGGGESTILAAFSLFLTVSQLLQACMIFTYVIVNVAKDITRLGPNALAT